MLIHKYNETKQENITITAQDISTLFEIPTSQSYRFLENATKSLLSKGFFLLSESNTDSNKISWLESVSYKDGQAKVELKLSDELVNLLNNKLTKFISINNNYIFDLKTYYSIRIYEICCLLKENKQNKIKKCTRGTRSH